jgi:hypothetical protein
MSGEESDNPTPQPTKRVAGSSIFPAIDSPILPRISMPDEQSCKNCGLLPPIMSVDWNDVKGREYVQGFAKNRSPNWFHVEYTERDMKSLTFDVAMRLYGRAEIAMMPSAATRWTQTFSLGEARIEVIRGVLSNNLQTKSANKPSSEKCLGHRFKVGRDAPNTNRPDINVGSGFFGLPIFDKALGVTAFPHVAESGYEATLRWSVWFELSSAVSCEFKYGNDVGQRNRSKELTIDRQWERGSIHNPHVILLSGEVDSDLRLYVKIGHKIAKLWWVQHSAEVSLPDGTGLPSETDMLGSPQYPLNRWYTSQRGVDIARPDQSGLRIPAGQKFFLHEFLVTPYA